MLSSLSGVILTAARADTTICEVFGDLPTGLIPVNGKPVCYYILQQFYDSGIRDIYIAVDYKEETVKDVIDLQYASKMNIHYVKTDRSSGAGNSLLQVLQVVGSGGVVVNLADTIIKGIDFSSLGDAIAVSKDFIDERQWAVAHLSDGEIQGYSNKKQTATEDIAVIAGIYAMASVDVFGAYPETEERIEITDLLDFYQVRGFILRPVFCHGWLDFGHIENYYQSRNQLLQPREFNSLSYDSLLGVITKRSHNHEKFRHEIQWQLELPVELRALSPKIIDYSLGDEPFVTMEFYSYPSISEIWLFSEIGEKVFVSIIDKLLRIMSLFRSCSGEVSKSDYRAVYIEKTDARVASVESAELMALLSCAEVVVNGKTLKGWPTIRADIFKRAEALFCKEDNCFIHGDFCFSNILYDLRSGVVRLIDPRGQWGSSNYGDIKYDIAKLRHSINGDYDYIVNDLFEVTSSSDSIVYKVHQPDKSGIKAYFDQALSRYWSLEDIILIEGLLFLSMLPLHSDSIARQKVMLAKAIEKLNQVVGGLQ